MYCLLFDTHDRRGTGFVLLCAAVVVVVRLFSQMLYIYEVFPAHAEFIGQPQVCWREKHPLNVFTISKDSCSLLSDIIKPTQTSNHISLK